MIRALLDIYYGIHISEMKKKYYVYFAKTGEAYAEKYRYFLEIEIIILTLNISYKIRNGL